MWSRINCTLIILIIALTFAATTMAQSGRGQRGGEVKKKESVPQAERGSDPQKSEVIEDQQEPEVIKVDTNLVTVPVIASDRSGIYVPDLRKDDFIVIEDGVQQDLVFFATVKEPFHVVLMLDTSASTQEKLGQIQRAAIAFVEELQPGDRVKVISFDDRIYDLNKFTNDKAELRQAINRTRPGRGTKLYDAVQLALAALNSIQGRKAIVLFTDGVDFHSDRARYKDNIRGVEETGVIVYPIRFDTREETERLARQQAQGGQTVDLDSILGGRSSRTTTPTTFPGGNIPIQDGPVGSSIPQVVVTRRRTDPNDPYPDRRDNDPRFPDSRNDPTSPRSRSDESIKTMLDLLYSTADGYLNELANKSGGRLHRADTLVSLPAAFAQIAAELRTQYSLGYYPSNAARDGKYRKIQVRSSRKGVAVRARPGYRAPGGSE